MFKVYYFSCRIVVNQRFFASLGRKNLYEILQVDQNASQRELKNAFYRLSKKYHPDVASSTECSNNKFVEIFNAYEILKDKQKRSEYDQLIKTKRQNAQQLYSLSKSKRNCLKQRQQQSSTQINSSSSPINLRIFSILTTKENNPFFDNLMKEDGWKKMKIFGIGFICFLLIYFVFVRFWYLKK